MDTDIETAMKVLLKKFDGPVNAECALKFTQSVLNLAHADATISNTEKQLKTNGY